MKLLSTMLILSALTFAPAISRAQPYDKAHQIKASEANSFTWPTYTTDDTESNGKSERGVMALQYLLRNRGFYKAKIDGDFGAQTEAAVRKFQRAKGLKADGIVGPQTWPPLLLRLKKGDRGDAVRALQIALRGWTFEDGRTPFLRQETDGVFGASTLKNVLEFQSEQMSDRSGVADGIVGPRTWGALLGAYFGGE